MHIKTRRIELEIATTGFFVSVNLLGRRAEWFIDRTGQGLSGSSVTKVCA